MARIKRMVIIQSDRILKRSPKRVLFGTDDLYFMTHKATQYGIHQEYHGEDLEGPPPSEKLEKKKGDQGAAEYPDRGAGVVDGNGSGPVAFRKVFGDQGQNRRQIDADRSTHDEIEHVKE